MNEALAGILDASALLAYLYGEEGAATVKDALATGCTISVLNWSEVLSKVADAGDSPRELVAQLKRSQLLGTSLRIEAFNAADAIAVAELRPTTRQLGLSLGDRACLALGQRLRLPVITADRDWQRLEGELGASVRLIR